MRLLSKVLAFTATVLGFVGLALAALGGPLGAVGLAMAALALLGLLAVAWNALAAPSVAPAQDVAEPTLPGASFEELGVPEAAGPAPPIDFEYPGEPDLAFQPDEEMPPTPHAPARPSTPASSSPSPPLPEDIDLNSPLQRALAGLPPKPAAPARYSPRMPVIPEEEPEPDEPVRRARRLVPSGQTLGEKREAARRAKEEAQTMEFTVVPAARPAVRPAVVPTPQVPVVVARVAGKGAPPPDLARGKCSGCDTLLWAPKARPLNLRCPRCDKITLLK